MSENTLAMFGDEPDPPPLTFAPAVPQEDPMEPSGFTQGRTQRGRQRLANAPCRSCNAAMLWVTFPSGKRNPLDAQPALDGNIILVERNDAGGRPWRLAMVVNNEALLTEARALGVPLYQSHFATCPDAAEHRAERARVQRGGIA